MEEASWKGGWMKGDTDIHKVERAISLSRSDQEAIFETEARFAS